MIYVVQKDNYDAHVLYAGSSAHEALLEAGKMESCRVTLWKNGKKFLVTKKPEITTRESVK